MSEDILELRDRDKLPWQDIADRLGLGSEASARRHYTKAKQAEDNLRETMNDVLGRSVLDYPIRPLAVPMPPPPKGKVRDITTALIYSDSHFPHHDAGVLQVVASVAEELQPDFLIHGGDLLDCYSLSRYDKNPGRVETLQTEIDQARAHLAYMRLLCPKSRFVLLEGNHEDRLRRVLWNLEGPAAALNKLTSFQKSMTWPALLGLDEMNIEWVATNEQAKRRFLPKWITKHGEVVRQQSAYTARAEHERYGVSGSSGHTHRLGLFFSRDHNGSHAWAETGCTCKLEVEFVADPNWQQGFLVVSFDTATGAYGIEPVFYDRGLAVWRGTQYRA